MKTMVCGCLICLTSMLAFKENVLKKWTMAPHSVVGEAEDFVLISCPRWTAWAGTARARKLALASHSGASGLAGKLPGMVHGLLSA